MMPVQTLADGSRSTLLRTPPTFWRMDVIGCLRPYGSIILAGIGRSNSLGLVRISIDVRWFRRADAGRRFRWFRTRRADGCRRFRWYKTRLAAARYRARWFGTRRGNNWRCRFWLRLRLGSVNGTPTFWLRPRHLKIVPVYVAPNSGRIK